MRQKYVCTIPGMFFCQSQGTWRDFGLVSAFICFLAPNPTRKPAFGHYPDNKTTKTTANGKKKNQHQQQRQNTTKKTTPKMIKTKTEQRKTTTAHSLPPARAPSFSHRQLSCPALARHRPSSRAARPSSFSFCSRRRRPRVG